MQEGPSGIDGLANVRPVLSRCCIGVLVRHVVLSNSRDRIAGILLGRACSDAVSGVMVLLVLVAVANRPSPHLSHGEVIVADPVAWFRLVAALALPEMLWLLLRQTAQSRTVGGLFVIRYDGFSSLELSGVRIFGLFVFSCKQRSVRTRLRSSITASP